ncbi:L2 [Gammapapillomavirus 15]|uniref:Minor capsid protein L2 n=1 Tax=Gammapapillomavirus 15 TaxID=1513260 RepID=A0A2D2ALS4_9PAPI|nr:L2 [Gammapapillomavirus 15]
MLRSTSRRKRAAVEDLYKSCKLGGDCPPDVVNKVEGKTLADRLLQIFGSLLYFGNLGIGSGRGTGGFGGYRPIGGTAGRVPEISVSKPSIPIDPLGGADVIPLDVINPEAPAIIPLSEGALPDIPLTDNSDVINIAEVEVTTHVTPTDGTPITNQQPTIISEGTNINVIDFQPGPPPPKRIALDVGFTAREDIELNILRPSTTFDPNVNVYVDPQITGDTVGFQEIELEPLNEIAEFEIEEVGPKSSTPLQPLETVRSLGRRYYNRLVQQVQTRNPQFLSQPSRLVTFEIENPAFDNEISLQFEQDVNDLAAAPDADFQDIIKLGRPEMSEYNNKIRVSRFGQKASMTTRSGLKFGQRVHYFYELSSIAQAEEIELQSYGRFSGESVTVNAEAEASFIDSATSSEVSYPEEMLIDPLEETFENGHLVLSFGLEDEIMQIPTLPPGIGLRVFVGDVAKDIFVDTPTTISDITIIKPYKPYAPIGPSANLQVISDDYIYDPDVYRKRRKRKIFTF